MHPKKRRRGEKDKRPVIIVWVNDDVGGLSRDFRFNLFKVCILLNLRCAKTRI